MGSSKIIMLSGIYLILGYYSLGFYQAERTNGVAVVAAANTIQAEQLARTGVSLALARMGDDIAVKSFSTQTATMSNGTISYSAASLTSTTSQITSTAVFNGRTITMTAVFTFDRGRWRVTRTYATPTAEVVG